MKYCPYCGAAIADSAASFCAECGRILPGGMEEPREKKKLIADSRPPKKKGRAGGNEAKQKKRKSPPPGTTIRNTADDGYDGYYDDVLPSDMDRQKEGLDKDLVKKIAVIAGAVLLIAGLCVLALYIL